MKEDKHHKEQKNKHKEDIDMDLDANMDLQSKLKSMLEAELEAELEAKAKAEDLFEEVTPVDGGIADEFGFLTGTMTEKEFNETISQFDTFITRIRVGF